MTLICAVVIVIMTLTYTWTATDAMELTITKQFPGGFESDFCYPMPRQVQGWRARLTFDPPIDRLEIYSANVVNAQQGNTVFIITNKDYNGDLNAGQDLCLKFTARTRLSQPPKVQFSMEASGMVTNPTDLVVHYSGASDSGQPRNSHILWQLKNFPSSGHDFLSPFNPQSRNQFGKNDSMSIVDDPTGLPGKVLRIFYQKGHYTKSGSYRGAQFYGRPTGARTTMVLSYDIYFSPGFDFVKGGKLAGLFGGSTNCSGGHHSDLCFSTRLMWRHHGDGEVYAYIPAHQDSSLCHDDNNECNPVYGISLGRGSWRFKTGEWQTITQKLTLNTPGDLNGKVEMWYNGHRVLQVHDLNVRVRDQIKIEGIVFSTIFGGSDSSWAPTADCYTYYKNFVLATGEGDVSAIVG